MEKVKDTSSTATVVVFLVLEVLAFVAFSLGNSLPLYGLLGLLALIVLIYAYAKDIKKKGYCAYAIFLIPLLVFGILITVGGFSPNLRRLDQFIAPIVLLIFASIGFFVNASKEFSLKTAFLVIYCGLGLLVLLSWGYTMIQFKPFYTITLRNSYFYYDGQISPVAIGKMAFMLTGFDFVHVSLEYFNIFPTLLATSVIGLFFISPKTEKKMFYSYLGLAILGIIPLITMPSKMSLITDVGLIIAVVLVLLFGKLHLNKKILIGISIGGLGLFGLLLFILFLGSVIPAVHNALASNPITNKIFLANGLCSRYYKIINYAFSSNGILGWTPESTTILGDEFAVEESGSWLFDNLMITGPLGGIIFLLFIGFAVFCTVIYCLHSKEKLLNKSLLVSFLIVFFGYSMVAFDMKPYIYYLDYQPMVLSGPFLICLFLFGITVKDVFEYLKPSPEVKEVLNEQSDNNVIEAEVKEDKKVDVVEEEINL